MHPTVRKIQNDRNPYASCIHKIAMSVRSIRNPFRKPP